MANYICEKCTAQSSNPKRCPDKNCTGKMRKVG